MLDKFTIWIVERVECFKDCWDSGRELHYTKEYIDIQKNYYTIELKLNEVGELVETESEIKDKIELVRIGNKLEYDVVLDRNKLGARLIQYGDTVGEIYM